MNENQIIQGCKNGDRSAQRKFVDQYSGYLFTICRRYTCDQFTAQDCLQETLLQVLTRIDQYNEVGRFKSWISRIAVTKCLEHIRKNKKHKNDDLDHTPESGSEDATLYKLELDDVMQFLETLPYNYRVAINMYLVEGYSHREIGEFLGVTEGSSRSLVTRARQMIQSKFESEALNIVFKKKENNVIAETSTKANAT